MQDCNYLYALAFTVGGNSGIALVSARSEADAMQILRNSGQYNGIPFSYIINKIQNIGLTSTIRNELLLESYVNAMGAYESLINEVKCLKGEKGDKGDPLDYESVQEDSVIADNDFICYYETETGETKKIKWTTLVTFIDIPVAIDIDHDDLHLDETKGLQFANREYNLAAPYGLGYKILRKGSTLASQVVSTNTIYELRYDFDLDEGSLTVPEGCTLKFVGGSVSNGTITGNATAIEAPDYQIFNDITFAGTFRGALNAVWVGAKSGDSSYDNAAILQAWFSGYASIFKKLYFPTATYYFLSQSTLTTDTRNLVLDGCNSLFCANIPTDDEYVIKIQTGTTSAAEGFRFENIRLTNNKTTSGKNISRTRGILLDGTQRFEFCNIQISYFDIAVEIVNTWYGGFSGQCGLRMNRIGLFLHCSSGFSEINTLDFHNITFKGVARSVVEVIYPQEAGESEADYVMRTASCGIDAYCLLQGVAARGCVLETFDYAIRTNWWKASSAATSSGGTFAIDSCYFEDNRVEDIYVGPGNYQLFGTGSNYHYFFHEMSISNCRFFTIQHVYLYGVRAFIYANQAFTLQVNSSNQLTSIVDYQGPVTIGGTVGNNVTINKIGGRNKSLYASNGTTSAPSTNFQKLQQTRDYGTITSRLNGYSRTSTASSDNNVSFKVWNFETEPKVRYGFDILPHEAYYDGNNEYFRDLVPSGNSVVPVTVNTSYQLTALNTYGSISLYEFIRRWKAGSEYTGTVKNLYPYKITANPTAGTVVDESGNIVGFGINALGSTITTASTGTYRFIDALIVARISYSRIKQSCDLLQNGRDYSELRGDVNAASSETAYLSCYGNSRSSVQKRINAVYYQTSDNKLYIYNGFDWVEMTSPFQRYYYKSYGVKLAERATMADLPGQTFTNYATGITYTFAFRPKNSYKWVPSIGLVDSLDHPNGYDDDNTLDYATELSAGEMVIYNGDLYKWNGSEFEMINSTAI